MIGGEHDTAVVVAGRGEDSEVISTAYPGLVSEIRRYGTFDANACLNCGSCSVVCSLSNGRGSFPRRPLQMAVMGAKESLLGSLEPWLCYDCGDCSTTCPRQTEPAESMMTLRRYLSAAYDATRISTGILTSKRKYVLLLASVMVLVFALVVFYHLYFAELQLGDFVSTSMGLEHMFNIINYFAYAVFGIPVLILIGKSIRMRRLTMGGDVKGVPLRFYVIELKTFFLNLLTQRDMRECEEPIRKRRWGKHWSMGFAFAAKGFIVVFLLKWFQTDNIYPIYNPQRWIGYIIAAILIIVPFQILVGRISRRQKVHKFSEFADLVLPAMLLLVAVSGILVHTFRYFEIALACHYAYAFHVAVASSLVLIELPFGKLSHVLFRPFAIYMQAVKERAASGAEKAAAAIQTRKTVLEGTETT